MKVQIVKVKQFFIKPGEDYKIETPKDAIEIEIKTNVESKSLRKFKDEITDLSTLKKEYGKNI